MAKKRTVKKKTVKLKWQKVAGEDEVTEVPLSEIIDERMVCNCCERPDRWFRRVDATPTTDYFYVCCKRCGAKGEESDWSWETPIAYWNIAFSHPNSRARAPTLLANRIEAFRLDDLRIRDICQLVKMVREATETLRSLSIDLQESRLARAMKIKEDEQ